MKAGKDFAAAAQDVVRVRFSGAGDFEKVFDYYGGNRHHHVHVRDRGLIERQVGRGQFLLVEKRDGGLVASSAVYDYNLGNGAGRGGGGARPDYYEVGSTNFSEEGRGYELYQFMIASQVVETFLRAPPEKYFIANVYDSSPVGREMLTKIVGWKVLEPEEAVLEKFRNTKADPGAKSEPMTWYAATSSTLPHQARLALGYMDRGEVRHRKTGRVLALDLSGFSLANEWLPQVKDLASGDFGRRLEAAPDFPLARARAMLDGPARGSDPAPGPRI